MNTTEGGLTTLNASSANVSGPSGVVSGVTVQLVPQQQLQALARQSQTPNFRDISKLNRALHENVTNWLSAYEHYRFIPD